MGAEGFQPARQEAEVLGLFQRDCHPAIEERARHCLAGKAGDDVEREIDGVQFDMGERVDQSDAAFNRMHGAPLDRAWRNENRFRRAARSIWQHRISRSVQADPAREPEAAGAVSTLHLGIKIAFTQRFNGRLPKRRGLPASLVHVAHANWRAASSTSSAWPGTFTFGQSRTIVPSEPTSAVVRSTPI